MRTVRDAIDRHSVAQPDAPFLLSLAKLIETAMKDRGEQPQLGHAFAEPGTLRWVRAHIGGKRLDRFQRLRRTKLPHRLRPDGGESGRKGLGRFTLDQQREDCITASSLTEIVHLGTDPLRGWSARRAYDDEVLGAVKGLANPGTQIR